MTDINLLPIELSPIRGAVKLSAKLTKIAIIISGCVLLLGLAGVVVIVFLSSQINTSMTKQASLKQSITNLESTEQKAFLVKDRIDTAKAAFAYKNAGDALISLDTVLSNLPSGVIVNTVQIDSAKTDFAVISKDSLSMATFMNSLVTTGTYTNLALVNFSYTPSGGYTITLENTL